MPRPQIEIGNALCTLPRETEPRVVRALYDVTSYMVEGHEKSPAFQRHVWDGKEHLLVWDKATHKWTFPAGLISDVMKLPIWSEFDVVDARRPVGKKRDLKWVGHEPRDYQQEAIEAAVLERGLGTGHGLLNLPIRTGKTLVAGRIIQRLGVKALFVVPSQLLLAQTVESFRSNLGPDAPIGKIGDGEWAPDWITVATIQSLIPPRKKKAALKFLESIDLLIIDESHHMEAPAWREPMLHCNAPYKIGLSATLYLSKDVPSERSAIWLKAVTGPILYKVSMQRMFSEGHLIAPNIVIYPVDQPTNMRGWGYTSAYEECIVKSEYRNGGIADLAEQSVLAGKRVLIDTGRLSQMDRLHQMLNAREIGVESIHGKTPSKKRATILERFRSGKVLCLVGTVMGEGVDLPELDVVINAEGQKSKKAVIQRMRNLTPSVGKTAATFIDFADMTHPRLQEHSLERMRMYTGIRGFKVHKGEVSEGTFTLKLDFP